MAASIPPSTPPRIGRFQVLRELGRGAQATVWLAHDPRLDRDVALKVLAPAADPALVDAGLHEARAVARLMHPHIVPVFEADQQDGQAYMVFEYVPGLTLTEKLQRNPVMKAREAVELMLGVLDGLPAALHVVLHTPDGDLVRDLAVTLSVVKDNTWSFCGG